MPTKTDICNMALSRVGGAEEQEKISSFQNDTGPTAAWCRIFYPHCLRLLFERWDFHEASAYADLGAALAGSSIPEAAEWEHVFNLPSDYVGMVKQTNEDNHHESYDYKIQKKKLFTNTLSNSAQTSAYIEYTTNEENTALYTATMTEALIVLLASKLAGPVAKDDEQAVNLLQEYERLALQNAEVSNQSDKAEPNMKGKASWLNARNSSIGRLSCGCYPGYCSC